MSYPVAILAGGLATRMRPLTEECPKSLLEVNGIPFIAHQLRLLREQGITRVVLCLGHMGEKIKEHLGAARFGLSIDYSFDGPALLGTGGALIKALPQLGERFFVLYGDSYLQCDYRAVQTAFEREQKMSLMTLFRCEESNVEYDNGRILDYNKVQRTMRMQHIDYGLGVFSKKAFADFATPLDLADVYRALLAKGELAAYEVQERFYEIGSPEGLEALSKYLKERNEICYTIS